jgi:hypothetical protein
MSKQMMMKTYLISSGFVCLVVISLFLASEVSGQQQQIQAPQTLQPAPPQTPQPSSPQLQQPPQQQIPQQPPQQQIPQQPPQQQIPQQPQQGQQLVQLYNPNQVVACLNNVLAQSIMKAATLNNNTRGISAGVNSTFMDNATKTLDNCIVPTTTMTR